MKIVFSINLKLLLFILPLVCLPIGILGYFSIHASADRVNRLVRHEQMVKVQAAAGRIRDIFYGCRIDLETIAGLPVMEDYQIARSFRLEAETQFNREKISRLLKDFILRATFYYQIRLLDSQGRELIKIGADGRPASELGRAKEELGDRLSRTQPDQLYVSDIVMSGQSRGYLMHWAIPIYSGWREYIGGVVIDMDYEKIIRMVNEIRIGENGYAFLIDGQGRVVAHPVYVPYEHELETFPEPSLRSLIREMITGASGWKTYEHQKIDKVAAFAPVQYMGWSMGVTIPLTELGQEARAIKSRVIQVGAIVLICALLGVTLLTFYLLKPVRTLVSATNRIAEGDLDHTIPVVSRDELGELTQSFNHMVANLARSQEELVRSEKLVALGRLSAGVAHEVRNPLNAIKGAIVHLQRRRPEDPLVNEYAELVSGEIDQLNAFITEFLYFARQAEPRPLSTDLNQLILKTQKLFQKQARQGGIRFLNRLDSELKKIALDPGQIERVIKNVLVNAMDALPDGGDILFTTSVAGNPDSDGSPPMARIEIEDNGIGIPEEHMPSIFDPFFSTKEMGTGLGLPLSLGIVESHSGRMGVTPGDERGVRVTIDLPVTPALQKPEGSRSGVAKGSL